MRRSFSRWLLIASLPCALALPLSGAPEAAPPADAFETLAQKLQSDPAGASEAEALQLLDLAQREGRPFAAALAVRGYLSHHFQSSPALLLQAARIARAAGDFRAAATRYKGALASLANATNGDAQQASLAAAELCQLLIDVLGDRDDSYQFLTQSGEKLRANPAVRRYDAWYADQARQRRDLANLSRLLTLVMADKAPLELERLHFWDHLDFLADELTRAAADSTAVHEALPHCRRIAALIRDDAPRARRFAFYTAHAQFMAATARPGDAPALDRQFQDVLASAKAAFDASPTADTLRDLFDVFAGGHNRASDTTLQLQLPAKQRFFTDAFARLDDAGKLDLMTWRRGGRPMQPWLASPAQWAQLCAAASKTLRSPAGVAAAAGLDLPPTSIAPADLKALAPVIDGVPSASAAAVNALAAANSDDFTKALTHLAQKESWHLRFSSVQGTIDRALWPAWRDLPRAKDDKKPGEEVLGKALATVGQSTLARSPLFLIDTDAARAYVLAALRHSGNHANDKSRVVEHLDALAWIPYSAWQRNAIFNPAYDEFKKWAEALRKEAQRTKTPVPQAQADQIAAVESAFKKSMASEGDLNKAPDALCKAVAQAMVAERDKDVAAFERAGLLAYDLIKDYSSKRTPWGGATLAWLTSVRPLETTSLQCKVLTDQFARLDPRQVPWAWSQAVELARRAAWDRREWQPFRISGRERAQALQLAAMYAAAVTSLADRGQFDADLFDLLRGTRRGRDWSDDKLGADAMDRLIQKNLLKDTGYRADNSVRGATTSYMFLVRNEFPTLREKYPIETAFDAMFIAEAKATSLLDPAYWNFGQGQKNAVVNAAAEIIAAFDRLPLGYGGGPAYNRGDFFRWQATALGADRPVRDAMLAKVEASYGKGRFDETAMGRSYFTGSIDLRKPADRKTFFQNLDQYLARMAASPARLAAPPMTALASLPDADKLAPAELDALVRLLRDLPPERWQERAGFEPLAMRAARGLMQSKRWTQLAELSPTLWKIARDTRDSGYHRDLARFASALHDDKQHEPALVLASVGQDLLKSDLPDDTQATLAAVRSKALSNIGGVIPVKRSDPLYPIYTAQSNFLTGRTQAAWEVYLQNRALALTAIKDLDPSFGIWLIDRNTQAGNFDVAETLARGMIQWLDSVTAGVDPEVRARLLLSYANLSLERQEYPKARAQFERIAAGQEFENTRARDEAQVRVADVDRRTGRFDQAIDLLEKLSRRQDAALQAEALYHLALVKFDQQEFSEARDYLDKLFARAADHSNGRLLEGQVNLKLKKLEEPTELQIGTVTSARLLVPGRPLRVALEDKNLATIGAAQSIELRAWTDSGDEELFTLLPFGDSKTRFRGQINTAMGPTRRGDHTLQVLGGDTIHYDYSEAFKAQQHITGGNPATLSVATDAELFVSSGRILTREELQAQALEQLVRQRVTTDDKTETQAVALSTLRPQDQIKPGNPINVRVIDHDRNTTAKRDRITVRVATSSGDRIPSLEMTETDDHSGVFEAAIPTASGYALAYASDSDDGRDPNAALSTADYPVWNALPDNQRPKTFSIDLNDNVAPATMSVLANVPGRRLKDFRVQVSLNGKDFTTVGAWPKAHEPWDGAMRVEFVRLAGKAPARLPEFQQYFDLGHLRANAPRVTVPLKAPRLSLDGNVLGQAQALGLQRDSAYITHFQAAFYQPLRQVRAFELSTRELPKGITALLTVDGQPGETPAAFKGSLAKGVHRIDIYLVMPREARLDVQLMTDSAEPPYTMPSPPEMFDLAKNASIRPAILTQPALVTASPDNASFDIAFADGTQARVVRLVLADFETDAPAINRIGLTTRDGRKLLPTAQDFTTLRRNQTLEVVPGDRITVSYEDPVVVSRGRELQEASLTATYANAAVSAVFVQSTVAANGKRNSRYIPMRRFKQGDTISIFVRDPDADVSDQPDTLTLSARTNEGKPVELKALETDAHSGVFVGNLFPVASQPQREGEILVTEGDDVTLSYIDRENTDPGVPWIRTATVEQVTWSDPLLSVYNVTSQPLADPAKPAGKSAPADASQSLEETVEATRAMIAAWPGLPDAAAGAAAKRSPSVQIKTPQELAAIQEPARLMVDGPVIVELIHPAIAQSPESKAVLYVQTSSGRKLAGKNPADSNDAFDITVPGTLRLEAAASNARSGGTPPGYRSLTVLGNPYAASPLDDGRFTFLVPTALGMPPAKSLATDEEIAAATAAGEKPVLMIRGDDQLFFGFRYTGRDNKEHWLTRSGRLAADAFFDIMDRRYVESVQGAYVGETLYFRVIDKQRDVSDEKDTLDIELAAASGARQKLALTETFSHSGVFKGLVKLSYAAPASQGQPAPAPEFGSVPVTYGDTLACTYAPAAGDPLARGVGVFKGSDGTVFAFTKRFKDPSIAVQTQFTVAESYFELAKRHRELGHEKEARDGIAEGKKQLEDAVRLYPDSQYRVQADYLLANLSLEFANESAEPDVRKAHYEEAVARFSDLVATYPDSTYAPKAQFKKALAFEKMGLIDLACEEYVKLSYRYPDSDLIAETIARLGQYFAAKGEGFKALAAEQKDAVEKEKVRMQGVKMYRTAAEVLGRLSARFPQHELAAKTLVGSAQCYMFAEDFDKATATFQQATSLTNADPAVRAEAMYWCGDAYMRIADGVGKSTLPPLNALAEAYKAFRKLTIDHPESYWAKVARGRLTDPRLVKQEQAQ